MLLSNCGPDLALIMSQHSPNDAFVGNLPIRLPDLQLLHEIKRALRRHDEREVTVDHIVVVNGMRGPRAS